MVEAREFSGVSFVKTLVPFKRAPNQSSNYLSKPPRPDTIILGTRFQYVNLGGIHTLSQQMVRNKKVYEF